MRLFKYVLILYLLPLFLFFNSNCTKEKTELDHIKDSIERIVENVENKNPDNIMLYISENYSDQNGRNKEDIKITLENYIKRYKGIVVNILEVKPIYIKPLNALIEAEIALSSGIARALRKVTNIASRYYKFTIEFTKEGSIWIVKSTKWRYLSNSDLSVESKNILKLLE